MKVFISQSRDRSRAVAFELQKFVRKLVPATDPWVSNTGIEKGSRWSPELAENLESAGAGVICLDADNLDDRWILFEAGALSRKPKDKVWTFLLGVEHSDVEQPLSQFQHTKADKDDVLLMIESINRTASAGAAPRNEGDLRELFELLWPKFDARLTEIRAMKAPKPRPTRSADDMAAETLDLVRSISARTDAASWMTEKTLKMLHVVYRAALGDRAPSLAALRQIVASWDEGTNVSLGEAAQPVTFTFADYYNHAGLASRGDGPFGKSIGELLSGPFQSTTAIRPKMYGGGTGVVSEPPYPSVNDAEATIAAKEKNDEKK